MVVRGSRERRNGESVWNGHRVSGWEDKKVLGMDGGDRCTTMRI